MAENTQNLEFLNKRLSQVMMKNNWTNEESRDRFIAVMNSFILSGKNSATQSLITNYLEKGMDVLNIELGKDELSKLDKTTNVSAEEINAGDDEVIEESQMKKFIDEVADLKIGLIKQGYSLDEANKALQGELKTTRTFKPLREAVTNISENVSKADSYKNNFATFFRMFLVNDQNWTSQYSRTVIEDLITIINNGHKDVSVQNKYIREFENLTKRLESTNYFKAETPSNKNLKVARKELSKYAINAHGWTGTNFGQVFTLYLNILINAQKSDVQSFISSKISPIAGKYKKKSKKKDK